MSKTEEIASLVEEPHQQRHPDPALKDLRRLEGQWKVEGLNFQAAPGGGESAVWGEASYSWLDGGFFLCGQWEHRFKEGKHIGRSMIGYQPETDELLAHNFDNLGYNRVYRLRIEEEYLFLEGQSERCSIRFSPDGSGYEEYWELSPDGEHWQPLCELKATKITASSSL